MKMHGAVVLALLWASTVAAQTVPPALMVQQDGRSAPLGLSALRIEVRIFGSVAETSTTMTFANPTARAMEGDLYFPLPEGATVSGYALDINGAMVDGVAVEKHEARRIFEEVERRGIDPGLVQWTAGNNFQTRVFPIPAHGSRTVRVSYVTELVGGGVAPAYHYHLPLRFKEKLREFSLRVEVVKPPVTLPPMVLKGELANFAFEKWRDSYVAETKQHDWLPVEDLVVALPKTDTAQVLVEKAPDGQVYFAIQGYSAPEAVELDYKTVIPRHVVVFWDASGSRAGQHQREIAVLGQYLAALLPAKSDGVEPKIAVDLVLFRNAAGKPIRVEFSKSNRAALAAELDKVQYDGGTQLGAIGSLPDGLKPDLYLLFTDGISNFGREESAKLDAPLVVFSAEAGANHALLHALALENGGRYFNLAVWKDADIVAQAGRPVRAAFRATNAYSSPPHGHAEDLYPRRPEPHAGRYLVVGKVVGEWADLRVVEGVESPGPRTDTHSTITYGLIAGRSQAAEGTLLARLWAQKKLADLMIHQKQNQQEITALGKQFGMVTPYTSLLVLDSLEQYVQYEIAPPKSLPAMRDEYNRRIDTVEHQKQKQKADKVAEVLRMWEARVNWWNNEFKFAKDFKYKGDVEGRGLPTFSTAPVQLSVGPRPAAKSEAAPRARPGYSVAKPTYNARLAAPAPRSPEPSGLMGQSDTLVVRETLTRNVRREALEGGGQGGQQPAGRQPGIVIKPWDPDTPYMKELRAAKGKAGRWAVYMKNRAKFGDSPAFFLDYADFFREAGDAELSLQVLSNIAELQLEDVALLRVLGHRLLQIDEYDLAVQTFEQVLALRPEEPQSCRDLALTLARRAEDTCKALDCRAKESRTNLDWEKQKPSGIVMHPKVTLYSGQPFVADADLAKSARADYARAIDLLVRVVMGRWDQRFPEIEVIALEELNALLPQAKMHGVSAVPLDKRLLKLLDVDIRIVMTWHADNTDIDLWVTEPSGEKAFYSHNRTTIGGLVSCDFTQGYGPEEYMVRKAAHGMYKIEANYFGSRATRLFGPVTVQVDVLTNFGRPNQQRKSLTIRLKEAQETVRIGEIEF